MSNNYLTGPIKVNKQAGNSAVIFGNSTFSGSSVYYKAQGSALAIGDQTYVYAPMKNGMIDNDVSDQYSGSSPTGASPVQN